MNFGVTLVVSVCFFTIVTSPSEARRFGNDLETIKRFPHYVTITNEVYLDGNYCSGSIIGPKWILTALNCVRVKRFTIYFLLESFSNPRRSFSLSLDESAVIPYPTGFDNIALIKLPITLEFSDLLKPIRYHGWDGDFDQINNGFAVMPGMNPAMSMSYGMYRILNRGECKFKLGQLFDDFMEICAIDWNSNNQDLAGGNEGSGLIQGWPKDPCLVGIFSEPNHNAKETGLAFLRLSKYRRWIDEAVISNDTGYKPSCCPGIGTTTPRITTTTVRSTTYAGPPTEPPRPPSLSQVSTGQNVSISIVY